MVIISQISYGDKLMVGDNTAAVTMMSVGDDTDDIPMTACHDEDSLK